MKINKNLKWSFSVRDIYKRKYLNTKRISSIKMRYFEDPLLKSKELILNNGILNLYSALTRIEDFRSKRPLNSIPYLTGKIFEEIKPLISEDSIKNLEYYMQQKISNKSVNFWINNRVIPFPFIRVISLADKNPIKKLSKYIKSFDYITNFNKSCYLTLPKIFNNLLNDDLIYFFGYLLGDGCISKERLIKLCDGHPNPKYVINSFKFLKSIQDYIKTKFNISSKLTKINNKYELILTSKSLCRFFKFFYDFRKDEGSITKPSIIIDNKDKSCIFYRGFFDADAGIKVKDKFLVLKCSNKQFLQDCKRDLYSYGINTSNLAYDNFNTPSFSIYAQNLFEFAKGIGFNHPRKKEILIEHLKNGCLIRKFNSVNKSNLINNKYYNLSKIQDLRIVGVSDIFKKYRKKLGTQKHVAKVLITFRENIKRWENNTDSIPFDYFIKLMDLNGFTLINILKDLSKKEILFGKGTLKQFIKLPIRFNYAYSELFQYLNPYKNKVIIKSYGIDDRNINRTKLFDRIRKIFNVKIIKDGRSDIVCSNLLSDFLSTFYHYSPSWKPLFKKEIQTLEERWNIY